MARSLPSYSTGTVTVAVANGSWTVTGSGTNFISPDGVANYTLVAGDMFIIPNVGFGPIANVASATSLTLTNWLPGTTVSSATAYRITRFEGLPSNQVAALVTQLLTLGTDANPPAYETVDTGSVRFKWDDDGAGNARMRVRASNLTDAAYVLAARVNDATGVWQVPAIVGARVAVNDAAYTVAAGVSTVAYTAMAAARTVTLPAANSFAPGQQLLVVDESGACSATKAITLARAGSDTINGATSAVISNAYGYLAIESNGSNAWTIVDSFVVATAFVGDSGSGGALGLVPAPPSGSAAAGEFLGAGGSWAVPASFTGDSGSGGKVGYVPAPPSASAASNEVLGAGGSWVGRMVGFRNRLRNASFAINQRAVSGTVTLAAGVYGHDGVKAGAAGATYTFAASGIDTALTITAGSLILPIEAGMIEGGNYVISQAGTAQARVWQGTGSTGSGSYAAAPFVASGLTAATQTSVEFSTGTVLWPQFEPGSIITAATLFERRPPSFEKDLCRYYFRRRSSGAVNDALGVFQAISTTQAFGLLWPLIPPMRGAPTVVLSNTGDISTTQSVSTAVAATAHTLSATPDAIKDIITVGSAVLTAGNATMALFNSTTGYIQASAEI